MHMRLGRAVVGFGLVLMLALTGCASGVTEPSASPSDPGGPTATASLAPVRLADLKASVEELITHPKVMDYWNRPIPGSQPGRFWCEGPDPVTAGAAVTCRWADDCAECAQATDVTQLVSVLDDTGRFTFTTVDSLPRGNPIQTLRPEDFPADTTSCAVLAEPQLLDGRARQLSYSALLHSWLSSGSPTAMDPDGDGRPCGAEYAADLVAAVLGSPLSATPRTADDPATMEDVRRHAEAVLIGVTSDTLLSGCGSADPAVAGATMQCLAVPVGDRASEGAPVFIGVLGDDGRYVAADAGRIGGVPLSTLADYPPDSTCSDLAKSPPTQPNRGYSLPYDQVYYRWLELGQPAAWDEDGDGRPCADTYGPAAYDSLVAGSFLP